MAGNKERLTDVSSRVEVFTSEKLTQEVEKIAIKYQLLEFHKHKNLQIPTGRLKDMIMGLVAPQPENFRGRFDIPVIAFGQIPAEDQAVRADINYILKGLTVRDWEGDPRGYSTPNGAYLTWMQDGRKNLRRNADEVRYTLDPDERGSTEHDGIGLYIARPNTLTNHYIGLPGTSVEFESSAALELRNGWPRFDFYLTYSRDPGFGSATCGRN